MGFFKIDPFGEGRADLRMGIIASTIANVNRGKQKPFKPADFMPFVEKAKETAKTFKSKLQHLVRKRA